MKKIQFSIDRTPPSLNTLLNMNYFKVRKLQRIWDLLIYEQWIYNRRFVFCRPVRIKYVISFISTRRRDVDNYVGGTKLVTDALKRTFIPRDDSEWVRGITVEFRGGNPETLIHIEEDVDHGKREIEEENTERGDNESI